MLRRIRKSSGQVTLVLIGVAAMSGCVRNADDQRRDVYASRQDCLADWGNKPEDCQPATEPRHRGLGYFYGPAYGYHSYGTGRTWTDSNARSSRAVGSTSHGTVSRGGFGSSARSSGG